MLPYAASVGWYASWLRALLLGLSRNEAEAFANRAENITGKGFTRCLINGVAGDILLSIPVEGGTAKLKRESTVPELRLSEHGSWRHVHQGALNAAYGRSPYFQHLIPELAAVYTSGEKSLSRFNLMLHEVITTFLLGDSQSTYLSTLHSSLSAPTTASVRGKELAALVQPGMSILDPLMRFGRETLLPLLTINS